MSLIGIVYNFPHDQVGLSMSTPINKTSYCLNPVVGLSQGRPLLFDSDRILSIQTFKTLQIVAFLLVVAICQGPVFAQWCNGYGALSGLSENTSLQRIGDAHRFAKAQSNVTGDVRDQDEVWLVSTRQLCQRSNPNSASTFLHAEVSQLVDGVWCPSSVDVFLSNINGDAERLNLLFIHGNRTDLQWANLRGVETYESIVSGPENRNCSLDAAPPIRWIIWAWNSDPLHGPRVDLAVKKQRAIDQGSYLREFFQAVEQPNLGVFAYSLGAQALTSSLSVRPAAGLAGEESRNSRCHGPRLDVVMVAGAVPTCWFNTSEAADCLPACVERLTLINNPADRALQIYRRFTHQNPIGLHNKQLGTSVQTETYLVTGNTLDNHYLSRYLEHNNTRHIIRNGLLPKSH
jgi:hypothetical protein